jgi:hypothetical protein
MMDLSSERVELYKRIFPAVDIRPLDLFPSARHKPIWDLKVNHLGRNYDVVGLFNFDENSNRQLYINWSDLGMARDQPVHVYDFWNKEYIGVYKEGYSTTLGTTSCKVLTLLPATTDIQLISTSRHLTQGWLDLVSLESDTARNAFQGRSRVIKDDPYVLTFVYPPGKNFAVTQAKAGSCPVKVSNHQGWATVEITPAKTEEVSWTVAFMPEPWYKYPSSHPGSIIVVLSALDRASVKFDQPGVSTVGAFLVSLDGELLGATKDQSFPLRNLSFGKSHSVQVASAWEDGSLSTNPVASLTFTLDSLVRSGYSLTDLEPVRPAANTPAENVRVNRSASGKALSVGGKKFETGLGAKTDSTIEYDLHGLFQEFTAVAGIDDGGKDRAVIFTVEGDGKELWHSGEVKKATGAKPVSVQIGGVRKLVLRAVEAGSKQSGNSVAWCDPAVRRN